MALTDLQRTVCRLLADLRRSSGESYVAGGVALNELLGGDRLSRDVDLFHDTEEAVEASWQADRERLAESGFEVRPLRQRPGFVEAEVSKQGDSVRIEWARDSAYRFFPLVEHEELGLARPRFAQRPFHRRRVGRAGVRRPAAGRLRAGRALARGT